MIYEYADKNISSAQFVVEAAAAGLTVTRVAHLSRRLVDGQWNRVPRYLLIGGADLTEDHAATLAALVLAHNAESEPDTPGPSVHLTAE